MQHKAHKSLDVIAMALGDFLFPHADLKLVIARSFEADVESAKDILSKKFLDSAARVRLNKGDLQRLGLKDGGHTSIKSKAGNIVVVAYGDEKVPEGSAVVPYGPWALALVSVPKDDSAPQFHGVSVTVTRSDDDVTPLESLLESS
ncbi:MAG: molybdopterin dinucleotide binding domain-containing protein [Candidatus Thorarchaeota archaeon]|jgi:formylmethanofuran dehydrogenase subunit D